MRLLMSTVHNCKEIDVKYMIRASMTIGAIIVGSAGPASAAAPLPAQCTGGLSASVSIKNTSEQTYYFRSVQPGPGVYTTYPQPRKMRPGMTAKYIHCTTDKSSDELKSMAFWSTSQGGDFELGSLVRMIAGESSEYGLNDLTRGKAVGTLLSTSVTSGDHLELRWELGDDPAYIGPRSTDEVHALAHAQRRWVA
jgi:hypothetical protein